MVLNDIGELKRTEEALRAQEEFFHLIAENIGDFIAVLDLDGRRIYNSPSYRQFFGSPKKLRGTDSFTVIHPDDRERVKQVFRRPCKPVSANKSFIACSWPMAVATPWSRAAA